MNYFAKLGEMNPPINLLQCVSILQEVNSHQIQDFKGKETTIGQHFVKQQF